MTIRCLDSEWDERNAVQTFSDLLDHGVLYQKLPALHDLLAVEPDVEIAADAVDMRFGSPVRAGVLGIGMTKRDMDSGNFFVLQNVSNDVRAGDIGADGKFAHTIAVFVGVRVSPKFVA